MITKGKANLLFADTELFLVSTFGTNIVTLWLAEWTRVASI